MQVASIVVVNLLHHDHQLSSALIAIKLLGPGGAQPVLMPVAPARVSASGELVA